MQIHAGRYKGRRIKTVANVSYRPTMALVRKSLFDIIGELLGYHVLDLYSGSGNLGFGAASRGAKSVTIVENGMRIKALLKINGSFFKETDVNYVRMDALKFLKQSNCFDLILVDPPYEYDQFDLLIDSCINQLNENRFFILESSLQTYSIPPGRVKEYGDTQLSFWKKEQ